MNAPVATCKKKIRAPHQQTFISPKHHATYSTSARALNYDITKDLSPSIERNFLAHGSAEKEDYTTKHRMIFALVTFPTCPKVLGDAKREYAIYTIEGQMWTGERTVKP
jgi:hypothetical protein